MFTGSRWSFLGVFIYLFIFIYIQRLNDKSSNELVSLVKDKQNCINVISNMIIIIIKKATC